MGKTYFNDAIVGNSRMLGCLSKSGELVRMLWPHISYSQHIDVFHTGILEGAGNNTTIWIHDNGWEHKQEYIENTNVLVTTCVNNSLEYRIKQVDFVLPGEDVLIRNYTIENISQEAKNADFIFYGSMISTSNNIRSTIFDFNTDSLVYYKHNNYIAISSNIEIDGFQLGNAREAAYKGEFRGIEDTSMSSEAGLLWHLGEIKPGQSKEITLYLYAAKTLREALTGVKAVKAISFNGLLTSTVDYWRNYIKKAKEINADDKIKYLYNRTLLTFSLMSDDEGGGILAAPEIDEEFTRCGRYGYCWGRDAVFITKALDKCGLIDLSDRFFEWAFLTRAEDGSWYQRYYPDGNLAPSWGIQVDEIGSMIWGIWEHYKIINNIEFLKKAWRYVKKAVDFLINFIDEENGLPKPSYDIWEERMGEHAYSSAAVYAGIVSAVKILEELGEDNSCKIEWLKAANNMKNAIENNFWDNNLQRFTRSKKVIKNSWEISNWNDAVEIEVNKKRYKRYAILEDNTIDASLIGISVPFEVFSENHEFVTKTVAAIETNLKSSITGGIKRYENDNYIGGNPWIVTTLWLALYYIKIKDFKKAREYFDWVVKHHADLGFLPEQIDKTTGKPAWVMSLTWSHAMFITVLFELLEQGEL